MEQHTNHTFQSINKQFYEMWQQHDPDLAVFTDSLVQVGQRVDNRATEVTNQI